MQFCKYWWNTLLIYSVSTVDSWHNICFPFDFFNNLMQSP